LADKRHLAFNIFDALSPHTVAGSFTRPIYTPRAITHFPARSAAIMAMAIMMVVMPVIVPVTVRRAAAHEDAACRAKLR